MNRRGAVAAGVVALWAAGMGLLLRRELVRPAGDRLAQAALRVTPGVVFYAVHQAGQQIGFASSTIDTTGTGIEVVDYFVADLPVAGKLRRASARSKVLLSRGMALDSFSLDLQSESGTLVITGRPSGDSLLTLATRSSPDEPPDTQRVRLTGPVLLPTLVPLAIALGERPRVGKRYDVSVFDPVSMAPRDFTIAVQAESLFVLSDSAAMDSSTKRWASVHQDTVRAWRLSSERGGEAGGAGGAGGFAGWVDAQGRVVQLAQPGDLVLRRTAYELAFENWRLDNLKRPRTVTADRDIYETTAIASSVPLANRVYERMRVRLGNVDLAGFDLAGDRQSLQHGVLTIVREKRASIAPGYTLPSGREIERRFPNELKPEPLLQSDNWAIVTLAKRIAGNERDPTVVAERLTTWVHDSLRKEITVGIPNALQVLRTRSGDCNEHTQLYLALARAAGIPARGAAGLAYVNGKFFYHAWPEVWLGRWVAVDPTFGEFPADAAHLRFVTGGLTRQAELLRLIGTLSIDVLEAR